MTTTTPAEEERFAHKSIDGCPVWWPQVHATARGRRRFTGMLLDRAEPCLDGDMLLLEFKQKTAVDRFTSSEPVLRAALAEHHIHVDITAVAA